MCGGGGGGLLQTFKKVMGMPDMAKPKVQAMAAAPKTPEKSAALNAAKKAKASERAKRKNLIGRSSTIATTALSRERTASIHKGGLLGG